MFVTMLAALTLVDKGAEASFDAPKRFVALAGLAIATAVILAWGKLPQVNRSHRLHLVAAGSFLAALLIGVVSALASAHRAASLDTMRTVILFACAALVGASSARAARATVIAFVTGAALNALLSLMQALGLELFDYSSVGGRGNTSALVGNDGMLAIIAAIACALMLYAANVSPEKRWASLTLACVFAGTLVVNRSLTAFMAIAAGVVVLAFDAPRRLRVRGGIAVVVLLVVLVALPGTRRRIAEVHDHIDEGKFNALTSYRLGPWMAAIEMARANPLLGVGPGTFGAEFVPHLVRAQLSTRHRLGNPYLTGSYVQAHSDYLQLLAEGGLLLLAAVVTACGTVLLLLFRRRDAAGARELLIVVVVAGVAALTWFSMQIPAVAILALVALGRGWTLTLERGVE